MAFVICMRVESDHPTKNGGWLHRVGDPVPDRPFKPEPVREARPDLDTIWKRFEMLTDYHRVDGFAMSLGVDSDALNAIGCAWSGNAWAFPMKSPDSKMIGIRLRGNDGRKWAITGSHQGLFIPTHYPYVVDDGTLYLTEGPTDLAAAMTIGLQAIGRPSCLGQEQMILAYLARLKARRLVIITDNDDPGLNGARRLQTTLKLRSCIFTPPTKDLREYVRRGGNAMLVEATLRDLIWKTA